MHIIKLFILGGLLSIAACDQVKTETTDAASEGTLELQSMPQKISYLFGVDSAKNLQQMGIEVDNDAFQLGILHGLAGTDPQLSEDQIAEAITSYQTEMTEKRAVEQKAQEEALALQSEGNAKEGAEFLSANGAKDGVTTTASGLQYRVVTAGSGDKPSAESTVEVHYVGRLIDGTEFDSSRKRGVPAQFGVTQVIPGWAEALQLMPEGSVWELVIPADLAYGPAGTGSGPIGPNQTLRFEVELLSANVTASE